MAAAARAATAARQPGRLRCVASRLWHPAYQLGAAFVAIPIGTLTALYLSEYASARQRAILKPMLEVLAGVPTVVYGFFALVYMTPFLDAIPGLDLGMFSELSASLVLGIMLIPMVSSISKETMNAVCYRDLYSATGFLKRTAGV